MTSSQSLTVLNQLPALRQQTQKSTSSPPPPPLSWSCHRCPRRGYYRFSAIRNRCLWCSHRFCLACGAKTDSELFEVWRSYWGRNPEVQDEVGRLEEMLLELGSCEKTGRPAATLTLDSTKARDKKTQEIKITIEEVEEEDSDAKHPKDEDADETNTGVTLCDTSFICFSEPIVMDDQSLLFTAFTTFKIEDKM